MVVAVLEAVDHHAWLLLTVHPVPLIWRLAAGHMETVETNSLQLLIREWQLVNKMKSDIEAEWHQYQETRLKHLL